MSKPGEAAGAAFGEMLNHLATRADYWSQVRSTIVEAYIHACDTDRPYAEVRDEMLKKRGLEE